MTASIIFTSNNRVNLSSASASALASTSAAASVSENVETAIRDLLKTPNLLEDCLDAVLSEIYEATDIKVSIVEALKELLKDSNAVEEALRDLLATPKPTNPSDDEKTLNDSPSIETPAKISDLIVDIVRNSNLALSTTNPDLNLNSEPLVVDSPSMIRKLAVKIYEQMKEFADDNVLNVVFHPIVSLWDTVCVKGVLGIPQRVENATIVITKSSLTVNVGAEDMTELVFNIPPTSVTLVDEHKGQALTICEDGRIEYSQDPLFSPSETNIVIRYNKLPVVKWGVVVTEYRADILPYERTLIFATPTDKGCIMSENLRLTRNSYNNWSTFEHDVYSKRYAYEASKPNILLCNISHKPHRPEVDMSFKMISPTIHTVNEWTDVPRDKIHTVLATIQTYYRNNDCNTVGVLAYDYENSTLYTHPSPTETLTPCIITGVGLPQDIQTIPVWVLPFANTQIVIQTLADIVTVLYNQTIDPDKAYILIDKSANHMLLVTPHADRLHDLPLVFDNIDTPSSSSLLYIAT
jgi:hypothetical protein